MAGLFGHPRDSLLTPVTPDGAWRCDRVATGTACAVSCWQRGAGAAGNALGRACRNSKRSLARMAERVSANDIGDSMACEAASLLLPHLLPQRAPEGRRRTRKSEEIAIRKSARARFFPRSTPCSFRLGRAQIHPSRRAIGGGIACSMPSVFRKEPAFGRLVGLGSFPNR